MAKLWQKDNKLNKLIEEFTVGNDYLLDKELLKYDIIASIAHAKMLNKIKIINDKEFEKLKKELDNIKNLEIKKEDEDCHTAIENHLVKKLGDLGKKIHAFRSRNDQVKVALHLYSKDKITNIKKSIIILINSLKKLSKKDIAIPGYTHYQKAMPSSFKLWANAFIAALDDDIKLLDSAYQIIDQNPLGSAAGYGVPYEIDKQLTTKEMGFKKIQETGYVQNSRGKFEAIVLNALTNVMLDLNKMATDLILFSMQEFKFIDLPEEFTTGSSIMPQKKNPDVLELIRGKYHVVLGYEFTVKNVCANLISGYHRDFQLTKEPLMKGSKITEDSLKVMALVISGLNINKENCKKAMTKDLYATEEAYKLVKKGMSFRDAYMKVKKSI